MMEQLGPYRVLDKLGAGGMGEVYRARDTRLERTVAIKVLPAAFAADAQARARFDREAQAISQLDHPHICALYDVGEHDGIAFLVMQYLEGETLEARLAKGPLPIDQTLKIAVEITSALERAHRAGIVHRDLKPGNIMLTRSGAKLLDFGLARTGVPAATASGLSMLPTTPHNLTAEGTILGTFRYMAPEQLEGKEADARTDIFALGVLIYEAATGRKAFEGKTQASLIAAIMSSEPPSISTLQPLAPPLLDNIVRTCLAKDPDERWQTAADVERQLRWVAQTQSSAASGVTATTATQAAGRPLSALSRAWVMLAVGIATGVLMAGVAWWRFGRVTEPAMVTSRLSIVLPAEHPFEVTGSPIQALAISPDGLRVVYVGRANPATEGARVQLFVRDIRSMSVQPLAGTGGGRQPFFSPDGTSVGFFTTVGEMKKVSVAGGPPIVIARNIDSANWATGVWLPDGTIVFGSVGGGGTGLQRISSDGGAATSITKPADGENHFQPAIVPGSQTLLFTVRAFDGATRIDAINLDGEKRRTVVENARNPTFLDAHRLAFARDALLLEAPFDTAAVALAGSPQPLTDRVRFDQGQGTPQLAVAANGTRVYQPAIDTRVRLGIVGRNGMFQELNIPADEIPRVALLPDGQRLSYTTVTGSEEDSEVRVYDLVRGSGIRFTRKPPETEAVWSRDGRWIAVSSRDGISIRDISGTERATVPRGNAQFARNMDWSPDGAVLAYTVQTGASQDIWVVGADGRDARRLIAGEPAVFGPRFSPDGKWLAFTSTESGRVQVFVQRYPEGERLPVSIEGGTGPIWRRDGAELFFQGALDGTGRLLAASVTASGNSLIIGTPKPLFDLRVPVGDGSFAQYLSSNNAASRFDVFPDGQRFVMIRGIGAPERELVVVTSVPKGRP